MAQHVRDGLGLRYSGGVRRMDYAVFADDEYVTNALLTVSEVKRMEGDGFRCVRVTDEPGEGLPAFRGGFRKSGYVARRPGLQGRWDR